MLAFSYGLVWIYEEVCKALGIGKYADNLNQAAPAQAIEVEVDKERVIQVDFQTTVIRGSHLKFSAADHKLVIHPGEMYSLTFTATNITDGQITRVATPNVYPSAATKYFNKTECFCFKDQLFAANETKEMPVTFVVDPAIPPHIDRIILSYSFAPKKGT